MPRQNKTRKSGTSDDELLVGIASANTASGGEVVLVGRTEGSWAASNVGGYDFCAAKLDADGNELWSWQVTNGILVELVRGGGCSFVTTFR